MIDDASLLHQLRALKNSNENIENVPFKYDFFGFRWKNSVPKISFAFFSEHGFQSEKLELLPHILSYTQYFFFVLKVSVRGNFLPTSFFKIDSWAEKSGIYCRQTTVFYAFLRHAY